MSGVGAGRGLHRDGDDVVDDEGDGGDLGDARTEVLAGDDVGAAGLRVDHDDLAVRERDEEQHRDDGEGDRQQQAEGGDADGRDEHGEDLLGAVGGRGDAVGREHAEGDQLAEALLGEPLGDERRAEELLLQPVRERLGEHVAQPPRARLARWRRRRRAHAG